MNDAEFLSAAEVAARLGLSLRTVRRRIADGTLPSVRIGRAVRVPAGALEAPRGVLQTSADSAEAAARDSVAPPGAGLDEDRAAYVERWNAAHWPDTHERMLARRRRAFAILDAVRATTKPPSGPHDTADALVEAVREEFGERLLDYLPSRRDEQQ